MIQISNLTLAYGDKLVLDRFSLTLPDTGVTVLSGPSGCGKTTLMRCIAGLERPQSGTISGIVPSETAFLFQEDRLFPWRTVEQHLYRRAPPPPRGWRSGLLAGGWPSLEGRKSAPTPPHLSGGTWGRRLALVRARWPWAGRSICWTSPLQGWTLSGPILIRPGELAAPVILVSHEPAVLDRAGPGHPIGRAAPDSPVRPIVRELSHAA